MAVGDDGDDDVAGEGPAVFAFGDVEVFVGGGVGGDDEAEAPAVVAVGAGELVGGQLLRGQHDVTAGAEDDAAGVHELAGGRIAEGVVAADSSVEIQVAGPGGARFLRLVASQLCRCSIILVCNGSGIIRYFSLSYSSFWNCHGFVFIFSQCEMV